jgi:uncharacterized membrane protein
MGFAVLSLPGHGSAQAALAAAPTAVAVAPPLVAPSLVAPPAVAPPPVAPGAAALDWRHSLTKALSYQTIVVATDQILYWAIVTGTTYSEMEFLAANAVTGIAYFVGFDAVWHDAGLDAVARQDQVSFGKALAYRVFDTVRVFGVALAVGTPLTSSLGVTAAIAATRTVIYMLHDYAWSLADHRA